MGIIKLQSALLKEAQSSPMLLSDLAGLELYISESYSNRSFIELLQNADDAEATKFLVQKVNDYIIVSNNGRPFTEEDVESLCRSASSKKVRGNTIGYRGIGFKSVVSIAKEVHLISNEWKITFSRELTKSLIPKANKVPLIRIPHDLRENVYWDLKDTIQLLKQEGYNTFFIFSGVAMNKIEDEFSNFPHNSLLFLRNILELKIKLSKESYALIERQHQNESSEYLKIQTVDKMSSWYILHHEVGCLAWKTQDNKLLCLDKQEALLHAFLPTEDVTGFPFIINGDFSTDPSRRHLIFDDKTESVIKGTVESYISCLKEVIFNKNYAKFDMMILLPYFDMKLIMFGKNSFQKLFCQILKEKHSNDFNTLQLPPSWINSNDYFKLYKAYSGVVFNEENLTQNSIRILSYLGCKKDDIHGILNKLGDVEISLIGYSEIAAAGLKEIMFNHRIKGFEDYKIFQSNGILCSLHDIDSSHNSIDENYVQLLTEHGVTYENLLRCLKKLSLNNISAVTPENFKISPAQTTDARRINNIKTEELSKGTAIPENTQFFNESYNFQSGKTMFGISNENTNNPLQQTPIVRIKKWRSVEENTLIILNSKGYKLKDVSTQNIGYDLEGFSPDGTPIFIEVKSIDYAGQKFRMTNNEYAIAQYKKDLYYLAIVLQNYDHIEINLIKNPISSIELNRQCVQWVWECNSYDYNPIVFNL